MRLKFVSEDQFGVQLKTDGRIVHDCFKENCEPLADMYGPQVYTKCVMLDLSECEFMDSSGVGWMLMCHKRFSEASGRFILHTVPPMVGNALKLLRMHLVLTIAKDAAEAQALAQGAA